MPIFRVPVKIVITEIYHVKADSKGEAIELAIENEDEDYCTLIEETEGDRGVYFPDVSFVRERRIKC